MSTALQLRRGTNSENNAFTGLPGEITLDTDLNRLLIHDGTTVGGKVTAEAIQPPSFYGSRGIIAGANSAPYTNIDYISIDILGNAQYFGALATGRNSATASSDGSRGIFAGGYINSLVSSNIEYVTIGTLGNALSFGVMTISTAYSAATSGN